MSSVKAQKETLQFQAEVKQLLHLVTHALYSNKEIFLRELISNASDAADKLRFEALSDAALFENDSELKIFVDFDKDKETITVQDNGIGMSREEVIDNIGTIAKSGTREFLEALTGDQANDAHLIGQFGVGFYSAFVVAAKVTVETRRAGMNADQGVLWESSGEGDYTLKNINKAHRGTTVTLHMKKEEQEFLDGWRLRSIITKYSDHILLPVVMKKEITPEADASDEEKKEVKFEDEVVNSATALWTLPKGKVKDEEYQALYKHISHDFEDPLMWSRNKVEGRLEYTTLLYIPARAPFDLWNRDNQHGLKLYVQRVFIMDDAEQLLPLYLRFVRGVVDSNDLPLNISRELLQNSKVIETIRAAVVKRVLGMLEKMAKEDAEKYAKFWSEFGQVLKEGPAEDYANKDRVAKLLRFATTHDDKPEATSSLDDYLGRMQKDQEKIYYVTADTFTAAKNSPHLEVFRKKGIEVLLLPDRVDEWLVSHLSEFEGKQLQSVAKGDLHIDKAVDKETEAAQEKEKDAFEGVIKQIKEILGDKVEEVRLTQRLTDSPACLVTGENDMSAHLARLMKAAGQEMPGGKPMLELNPKHAIIQHLKSVQDDVRFKEWAYILFDQAMLAEGGQLDDPATFVKRLNTLFMEVVGG